MTNDNNTERNQSQAPIIAQLDDINQEHARRAFYWTSFKPEERGESRRKEYADSVNELYAELWQMARTDEQKQLLATEMERYRQGYLTRMNAFLSSHANVASAMITGPARFPTARNQKRSQWADNKANELLEWDAKAQQAIKRKLLGARPDEEKDAEEWERVKRDVLSSITSGNTLIFSNLSNRLERMAYKGEVSLVKRSLDVIRQYNATAARPVFTPRHKVWTFEGIAERVASKREQAANEGPHAIAEAEGVRIVCNTAIDRVQIIFDAKPDTAMIIKLKGEAWKWSPSNQAWQRKLTEAAKASAKRIVGIGQQTQAA